jgi:hypothetical protein
MRENAVSSATFSCHCKACNTLIAFELTAPLPKIWLCPVCGRKNYHKPKAKTQE